MGKEGQGGNDKIFERTQEGGWCLKADMTLALPCRSTYMYTFKKSEL